MKKKLMTCLLVGVITTSLIGIMAEAAPEEVNVGFNCACTSLNPFVAPGNELNLYMDYTLEPMCRTDVETGELIPVMLKDYRMTDEEGFEYELEIYDYVHDSEGNAITASDIMFCLDSWKVNGAACGLNKIETMEVVDDTTLKVILNDNAYGLIEEIMVWTPIVSQTAFEESGDEMTSMCIGTGPYVITDFVSGASITFERNKNYWQTEKSLITKYSNAYVDKVNVSFIVDNSQMEVALQTGIADAVSGLAVSSLSQFQDGSDYQIERVNGNSNFMLMFSGNEDSPCQDKAVRQAISYAIDAAAIKEAILGDWGKNTAIGIATASDYNTAWEETYYEYDPEKARMILAEAGYSDGDINIVMTTYPDPNVTKMAEIVQQYLAQVGIKMEIVSYEMAMIMQVLYDPAQYDIIPCYFTGQCTTMQWASLFDQANYNGTTLNGFVDDELQKLLADCSSATNHTAENLDACWEYIKETDYMYSMWTQDGYCVYRTDFGAVDFESYANIPIPGCFTYAE